MEMWNEQFIGKRVVVDGDWFIRMIESVDFNIGVGAGASSLARSKVELFPEDSTMIPQKGSKEDMELRQWCITQALKRLNVEDYLAESERIYEWITSGKA